MRLARRAAFNRAGRQAARLHLAAALGVAVAFVALISGGLVGAAAAMRIDVASACAILASGLASAGLLAQARSLALRAAEDPAPEGTEPGTGAGGNAPRWMRRARRRAGWQQAAAGGVLATLAAGAAILAWTGGTGWAPGSGGMVVAACCLGGAFLLLVAERHLAGLDPGHLPEAPMLAALTRVPIAVLLLCGVGWLLLQGGIGVGAYGGRIGAALCLLVAAEMMLRALATLFVPFPPLPEARPAVRSVLAGALVLRRPRPVATTVRDWFGIDLARSWAIAFVRAALAPVLAVLVLFGWGLSGVEALRVDQRAIYERLGRPVSVLGPGLHLHLPWPLGRLRPMELGVLHDVPIMFDGPESGAEQARAALPDAEAPPGPEADRLWDETHPSEAAYLVASLSRGRQSFQSVNIDLRVVYRVGLSDAAAMAAAYVSSDPQRLVQARASRLLAHYFAHHTLLDVLGADRASFSHDIETELQAELDAIPAGVEILSVVVEAIHPPPGAAAAYHAVQTAGISAHVAMAEATGYAVGRESDASRQAGLDHDLAAALSHEAVVDATVRSTGFAADRQADAASPVSFLLERRLETLGNGLAHRRLLIIDHRIALHGDDAPIIDMRPPGSGGTAELPAASGPAQ